MARVFYDSGARVLVKEGAPGKLYLSVGEQEVDLTEALAHRVIDALTKALADLHTKDPRD